MDINSCDDAWNSEDELKDLNASFMYNHWLFYDDNPHFIKTFATFSYNADDTIDFGDCVVIPKGCVV
jgi:hypothetical protein